MRREGRPNASFGDVFNVSRVKNDKGFWDWTAVSTGDLGSDAGATSAATSGYVAPIKTGTVVPKSNYETAEERAARQILIVRQSSVSSAVELAVANKVKDPSEVINIARQFEAYVFGKDVEVPAVQDTSATGNFFEDMQDDLP